MKKLFFLLFFASISFASLAQTVATADTSISISVTQKAADVTFVTWQLTKISGPSQGTITLTPNGFNSTLNCSGLVVGKYVVQVTSTDNFGTVSNASIWNLYVVRVGGKLFITAGADVNLNAAVK